ncbi:MAG: anthranilate synthase component I [Deltaproteobacteria bacterium]|nr:anthranilate synthase component I [Deltaproteobacteria bacterium]
MKKKKYSPSLEEFKLLAGQYNVIPVYRDILADTETPVSAFLKIDDGKDAFLLESVEGGEKWGRYSLLGVSPRFVVRSKGATAEKIEGGKTVPLAGNPIDAVRDLMKGLRAHALPEIARFYGGAIGYIGYDMIRYIERLPDKKPAELGLPEMYLFFTDTFLVFDNVEHKVQIISNAYLKDGDAIDAAYKKAVEKIDAIAETLKKPYVSKGVMPRSEVTPPSSNFERKGFLDAVEKTRKYILEGDIIQAVISQRFSVPLSSDPFDIYRALRVVNPSPYMFFLRLGGVELVGSSPEILVQVTGRDVTVKPIAGTRKRGRDESEDVSLAKELLADPKERAEHIMLVDLGRNDVGRVSETGTVAVLEFMAVEKYSHVMHIVSNIAGRLKDGRDSFDALKSCFPAGTLTGAPKVRAMEIIEELEPCKREVYGGSVGYMGFSGNMDMCIAIRTMVIKDGRIYVQAGAGIVADSVPEKEFEETENKARGVWKAVEMAEEGLD